MARPCTAAELESLSGTARESARCYREWRFGRMTYEDYLAAIRGLGTHKDILTAVEMHERQRQELEQIRQQLTRIQGGGQPGPPGEEPLLLPANQDEGDA
jgi:hypothetical protein